MATRNITPRDNGEGNIGTNLKRWLKGWFVNVFVSGNITDGTNDITVQDIQDAIDMAESDGDMNKAVYDAGDNGVVDAAESLSDGDSGGANDVTAAEARTHIDDEDNPHSVVKADVGLTDVPDLDTTDAVNNEHTHANGTELDKVTVGDHDISTANPHSVEADQVATDDSGVNVQEALDAVESDQHTQGTDVGLDSGGSNPVLASEIIHAYRPGAGVWKEFYVTKAGNDESGDGSVGNPWLTIQYAIDSLNRYCDGADVAIAIYVGAGTFAENVTISDFHCAIALNGDGVSNTLIQSVMFQRCPYAYAELFEVSKNTPGMLSAERSNLRINDVQIKGTGGPSNVGIKATEGSFVQISNISDGSPISAFGVTANGGSIITHDGSSFGTTFRYNISQNGLVTDNITLAKADYDNTVAHMALSNNPHDVTADQVATNDSGETVQDKIDDADAHIADTANPHSTTKAHVGLTDVPDLDTTDAVNNEHTHANGTELDKVTVGDHDVSTSNPHSVEADQVATDDSGVNVQEALDAVESDVIDLKTSALTFIIDGGGSEITTGIKGDIQVPFDCTITKITMLADQSGSIVVDVWKEAYADFPPTDDDSIAHGGAGSGTPPTISGAVKSEEDTFTDYTTLEITAGDTLRYYVDSVTDHERVTIIIDVTRT